MRVFMCRPEFFDIEYEINPWMNVQIKADKKRARAQWEGLYRTIESCGAKIDLVPAARGLPDMCFTANAGIVHHGKIILAHFRVAERKGETAYFQAWFEDNGFGVLNRPGRDQSSAYSEGAGDLLAAGHKLFVGYGFRSEKEFYEAPFFDSKEHMIHCELVNPYFYHIDTCFCPLNESEAIWYPHAFSEHSQKKMASEIQLFEVVEEEARRFACNAVVLNKNVIIPTGCPHLTTLLEKKGYKVHACEVDEYIKAGGACKCLTLRLS